MHSSRLPLFVLLALPSASCTSTALAVREPMAPLSRDGSAQEPGSGARATEPSVQPQGQLRPGPWELTLGAAGVSDDRVKAGSAQAAGSLGYYFSENFELSLRQNSSYGNAGPGSPEVWDNTSRLAVDLLLPIGNFVPYVGVNLGYAYGDSIPDSMVGGPEAGAKVYFKDDVFVLLAVEYQAFFDSSDSASSVFDDAQLIYGIGLGVRF